MCQSHQGSTLPIVLLFFLFAMNEVSLHLSPNKKKKKKCLEFCGGWGGGGVVGGLNFVPQCLFFWSIMWCSQNGNDLSKDLANHHWPQAKYESEMFLRHPSTIFGYPTWSMYRNSLAIFIKIWWSYGYWKSQKAFDFTTFIISI